MLAASMQVYVYISKYFSVFIQLMSEHSKVLLLKYTSICSKHATFEHIAGVAPRPVTIAIDAPMRCVCLLQMHSLCLYIYHIYTSRSISSAAGTGLSTLQHELLLSLRQAHDVTAAAAPCHRRRHCAHAVHVLTAACDCSKNSIEHIAAINQKRS